MSENQGFLVVLKSPETYGIPMRKRYRGVDRMPSYRLKNQDPINAEVKAMDRYVFGGVRDENSGLIRSCATAVELLGHFRSSPREFELIWCRALPDFQGNDIQPAISRVPGRRLGFDIAGLGGDFWSIVADFPAHPRVATFLTKLNENGLFSDAGDARAYLKEYQRLQLADHDIGLEVLEVRLVEP